MKRFICILLVIILLSALPVQAYDNTIANELYNNDPIANTSYKSYAVMNCKEQRILESVNGDQKQPVGNLVKLMLIYMTYDALEHFTLEKNTVLKVPKEAMGLSGNTVFLDYYQKETVTVEQALQAVCMNSAQDAAYCLALGMAANEKEFVSKMNKKAEELGLSNTYFTDCTGIDKENQYSTANDMALLAYRLLTEYPQVTEFTSQKFGWFVHNTGKEDSMVSTNNSFLRFSSRATGLAATSSTQTGYCLAGSSEISGDKVICVVLGAESDDAGLALAKKLTEKSVQDYQYTTLDVAGTYVRRIAVKDGKEKSVKAETSTDFSVFVKSDQVDKVEKTVEPKEGLKAPLEEGTVVGQVVYSIDDVELGRMDIVAAENVEEAGFFTKIIRWFLSLFGIE